MSTSYFQYVLSLINVHQIKHSKDVLRFITFELVPDEESNKPLPVKPKTKGNDKLPQKTGARAKKKVSSQEMHSMVGYSWIREKFRKN